MIPKCQFWEKNLPLKNDWNRGYAVVNVTGAPLRFRSSLFTLSGIVARKHSCTFLDDASSLIRRLPSYFICLWNIYVRSKRTLSRKNQLRNGWEIASKTQQRHLLWSHSGDTVTGRHGRLPSLPLQCGLRNFHDNFHLKWISNCENSDVYFVKIRPQTAEKSEVTCWASRNVHFSTVTYFWWRGWVGMNE